MAIFQTAANARPGLKLAGLLLLLLAGAPDAGRAQSSPTISIVLSPGHMVPQNTVITATVTLDNLDPASYSSLVFRADLTEWDPHFATDSARCEGDDMDEDIPVEVDASRETFTVEVWKGCSAYIYAYYALDAALVRLPDRVELASAETRFAMTRYLEAGETPPPPPAPGVAAWLDPDPESFVWKVGEWIEFRPRSNVLLYLNHHVGVRGHGSQDDGARLADMSLGADAEEACQHPDAGGVNWRRAIHQPVQFVACRAGAATIEVWHETAAEILYTYEFHIRPADGEQQYPDLVVGSPTVDDSSPTVGATFTLSATVRNDGEGASPDTTLRYYRSTDATITTADTAEGTDAVRALVRPQGYAATISLTAPPTAGTYYYGACVDAVPGESDTTNNCSSAVSATVSSAGGRGGGGGGGARQTVPDAPTNLLADAGDAAVTLTWDAPEDDRGSEITDYQYRIDRSFPWISIGSTDTTHTLTGLVNGTEYVFEVRAVNRIGKSFFSNRAEATPEAPEVFTLNFAHFANGTGITSEMVLVNVSPHPIRPAIYFYDTEGAPLTAESVLEVTGDLEVTEDGSLTVRTEMEPLGELTISTHGQGELVSGSVKVLSDGPIGGGVRYGVPNIGVAGVGASPPVRDALFPARRQAGGIRTAAALHNLEASAGLVHCDLMREGMLLDAVSISLEANGQTSWFLDAAFPAADTSDFVGSVRCDAVGEDLFTAVALEMDPGTRIFTTLPVVPVPEMPDRE